MPNVQGPILPKSVIRPKTYSKPASIGRIQVTADVIYSRRASIRRIQETADFDTFHDLRESLLTEDDSQLHGLN